MTVAERVDATFAMLAWERLPSPKKAYLSDQDFAALAAELGRVPGSGPRKVHFFHARGCTTIMRGMCQPGEMTLA